MPRSEALDLVDRIILGEKGSFKDRPEPASICIAVRKPDSGDHVLIREGLIRDGSGFSVEDLANLAGRQEDYSLGPVIYEIAHRHIARCGKCYDAIHDILVGH